MGVCMIKYRALTNTLLLASMLATGCMLIITALIFISPRPSVITAGNLADFPASKTSAAAYFIQIDDYQFFVVNSSNKIIVLDARATTQDVRHVVKWVPNNRRYEDPLSASKYAIMGEWLEGPADRDLDQYAHQVIDGVLYVYPWQVMRGTPSAWPTHRRRPGLYSGGFCVDQGFTRSCTFP